MYDNDTYIMYDIYDIYNILQIIFMYTKVTKFLSITCRWLDGKITGDEMDFLLSV
jgi:hypothetical protein